MEYIGFAIGIGSTVAGLFAAYVLIKAGVESGWAITIGTFFTLLMLSIMTVVFHKPDPSQYKPKELTKLCRSNGYRSYIKLGDEVWCIEPMKQLILEPKVVK